jgi:transposase-like protein
MNLSDLQTRMENLSPNDRQIVINQLDFLIKELDIDLQTEQNVLKSKQARHCPHCQSSATVKIGKHLGIQRYACKDCKRNYRDTTCCFNDGLRKGRGETLKLYLKSFLAGDSLRKSAQICQISIPTSFNWRHRILAALQKQQDHTVLEGIVESDDVFIDYSEKGQRKLNRPPRKRGKSVHVKKKKGINDDKVAIIVSHDRQGQKHLGVSTRGRVSEKDLSNVLKDKIKKDSILCTDTHHSYIAFAKTNNLEHKTIKASAKEHVKEGKYHVQHVNQTAKEMKKWLEGFNGVATKYLQNYMNWFSVLKKLNDAPIPLKALLSMTCASYQAMTVLREIPNISYI